MNGGFSFMVHNGRYSNINYCHRAFSSVNRTSSSIRDLQNRATNFHSFVGAPQARVVSYVNGTLINADDADKENQRNRRHLRPFSFIRGAPQAHGVSSVGSDQ
jgi:hypothetical protein